MARDSLFPPKTPENRSFEKARLGLLHPNMAKDKGLSPQAQAVSDEVRTELEDPSLVQARAPSEKTASNEGLLPPRRLSPPVLRIVKSDNCGND